MHGATAYWLLNDETYREHKQDPFDYNPNDQVVRELLNLGVSAEICYSTMKGKGWLAEDLLPGVTIVHDAYTRLIDLQQKGFLIFDFNLFSIIKNANERRYISGEKRTGAATVGCNQWGSFQ